MLWGGGTRGEGEESDVSGGSGTRYLPSRFKRRDLTPCPSLCSPVLDWELSFSFTAS